MNDILNNQVAYNISLFQIYSMGQQQIASQKTDKIKVNQFPFQNKIVRQAIEYLLKTKEFKKVNPKQAQLNKQGEKFKFKTLSNFNELHKFTGFAQLYNKENLKIFEGQFINGNRTGFGIQYDLNGNTLYEGQFEKNLYNGWGVTPKYQGQYLKGKKSGWGVYEDIDKNGISRVFYEGFWLNDFFHGIGSLNVRGDQIELFLEDNPNINLGNYQVKYVGQWENGMINGSGKMVKKGQIYTGQFIDGNYEGDGILLSQHNPVVKGKFLQGKLVKSE